MGVKSTSLRYHFHLKVYVLLVCILWGNFGLSIAKAPPEKPNIILILADDLGWNCTSTLMDDHYPGSKSDFFYTPNIERLARKGMRFSHAYAPAAICSPSRRSIQFGQTPLRQGDSRFKEKYHPDYHDQLTIPNMLKSIDPNYQSAHYGKWDLRADIYPEDLGYDESDGNTGNADGNMFTDKIDKWTNIFIHDDPKKTESITGRALNFIKRQVQAENPFYLQVSYYATHIDIQTKEETFHKYWKKNRGKIHDNPGFAAMLEDLDSGIGQILDMVEKSGIEDNTYIIFMSDNGAVELLPQVREKMIHPSEYGRPRRNFPLRGGKWTLYEGGIRVPFIVSGPGVKQGIQSNVPVNGWDILPTISDLAGNKNNLPDDLDGGSFRILLENQGRGKVVRLNEAFMFHRFNDHYPHSAILSGRYKLVKLWRTNILELYDLTKDIGETNDLSLQQPEKAKTLYDELKKYLLEVDAEILDDDEP